MERAERTPSLRTVMAATGALHSHVNAIIQKMVETVKTVCLRPDSDPLPDLEYVVLPAQLVSFEKEGPVHFPELASLFSSRTIACELGTTGSSTYSTAMPPNVDIADLLLLEKAFSTDQIDFLSFFSHLVLLYSRGLLLVEEHLRVIGGFRKLIPWTRFDCDGFDSPEHFNSSCETCSINGSSTCSGPSKNCASDVTMCVKLLETTIIGKLTIQNTFRGCLDPNKRKICSREISFRNNHFAMKIAANCCSSDNCNGESLPVSANLDLIPNGYKCGDCSNDNSASGCTAVQEILCTGPHYHCGSFSGTGSRPGEPVKSYSFKGCISQDACSTGLPNIGGTKAYSYQISCTPAMRVPGRTLRV
ncbi:uncharacterized protein LOC144769707 [Lissotriton helveticus]